MAVKTADPWGEKSSFENMTKSAGTVVVKAVSDAAKAVISDIKEQTGISSFAKATEGQGNQERQKEEVKIEQEKQKNLNEIKVNLQKINQEIQQVRRDRVQKEQQKKKEEKQDKQVKQQEEQKKNTEPFWKKMIRSGSREAGKKQGS